MQLWETLLIARDKNLIIVKDLEESSAQEFIAANGGRSAEVMATEVAMLEDEHGFSVRKLNRDGSIEDDEYFRILNQQVELSNAEHE